MRVRIMAALVGAMSAVIMLLTAAPASAATFDFATAWNPHSPHNGQAQIDGSISYFGRQHADIQAAIKDACPADGYGAYARLEITSTSGGTGHTNWLWEQDQGCGGTAVYPSEIFDWYADIAYIRIYLCERDHAGGTWKTGDCAFSTRKDNPYT